MDTLVKALKDKQRERGENQKQFSEYLGIDQSALSRLYHKRRGIGGTVLAKILTRFPEFASFFALKNADKG